MPTNQLKKLVVSDKIRGDEQLVRKVMHATDLLTEELGPSAGIVEADWRIRSDDQRRRVIELNVSDFTGSASARFSEDELADEDRRLPWRLSRLWGDLLQDRSRRQLEKLHHMVDQLEDT